MSNQTSRFGDTALSCASESGKLDCVQALIKAGADIDHKNSNGASSIHLAARHNRLDCVKCLVKSGAKVKDTWALYKTSLIHTVLQNHDDGPMLENLIKKGANVNAKTSNGTTAFMIAAAKGALTSLNVLLKKKVSIDELNVSNKSALMLAAQNGRIQCLDRLIRSGANVNLFSGKGPTAFSLACRHQHLDCVKHLINEGAEINPKCTNKEVEFPLTAALDNFNLKKGKDLLLWLLDNGANIHGSGKSGDTVLHVLLRKQPRDISLVEKCLDLGARMDGTNAKGETLLMVAAPNNFCEAMTLLLKKHVRLNKADKEGWTAIMHACHRGSKDCLDQLLKAGANINMESNAKRSALSLAVDQKHTKCVHLLGEFLQNQQNKIKISRFESGSVEHCFRDNG